MILMLFVVVIMIYPDPIKLQRRVGYNEEGDEMVAFVTVSNFLGVANYYS